MIAIVKLISILIIVIFLISIYYYGLRKTVFGISLRHSNYFGFFLVFELFFYLVPGVILLNIFSVENFYALFKVEQDSVYWISLIILASFIAIVFLLFVFSNIFKSVLHINTFKEIVLSKVEEKRIKRFVKFTIFTCFGLMFIVLITTDANHAFIKAITDNVSISIVRIYNKSIGLAKIFNHLFIFIAPLISIFAASKIYDGRRFQRIIIFTCALLISTYMGSKGPLMTTILAYVMSYLVFHNVKISLKYIAYTLLGGLGLFLLVYYVVTIQYSKIDFTGFLEYLINRIFVAQISGTYEQFNLFLFDLNYFFHSVPFASSFIDYPIFQKDLMLISENRASGGNIGIKNTFFIAEAYSFGGWTMVFLSLFIYAFNISITYIWFNKFFNMVIKNKNFTKYIVALFLYCTLSLTGGFSDIFFFKLPILMTILFSLITVPFLIVNYFLTRIRINRKY